MCAALGCGFFLAGSQSQCRAGSTTNANTKEATQHMSGKTPTGIPDWNPEDATYSSTKGNAIARRNLTWSIVVEQVQHHDGATGNGR